MMKKIFLFFFLLSLSVVFAREYGVYPTEIFEATPSREGKSVFLCFYNTLNEDLIFRTRAGSVWIEEKSVVVESRTKLEDCTPVLFNYKPVKKGVFYIDVIKYSEPNIPFDVLTVSVNILDTNVSESYVENPKPLETNPTINVIPTQSVQITSEKRGFFEDGKFYFGLGIGFVLGIIATVFYFILL